MAKPDPKILDAFRIRLLRAVGKNVVGQHFQADSQARKPDLLSFFPNALSAISRSPLMRVSINKTGRLLDLSRLDRLQGYLGKQILAAVIDDKAANIDFTWRFVGEDTPLFNSQGDDENQGNRKLIEQKLIEEMLTRIIRDGALA